MEFAGPHSLLSFLMIIPLATCLVGWRGKQTLTKKSPVFVCEGNLMLWQTRFRVDFRK